MPKVVELASAQDVQASAYTYVSPFQNPFSGQAALFDLPISLVSHRSFK